MQRKKHKIGIWAVIAGLIALSFSTSACTSTAPAPIVYGHAPAPILTPGPAPATAAIDFSTPSFDEFTAPRVAYDRPPSECVPFARTISGVAIWGDAVTWWAQAEGRYPRSSRPAEGSVLVLRGWQDDKRGHVAVVKAMLNSRVIRVDHANWLHGGEVSLDVPVIDVSPANDWTQVRVWHVPGMHWGGRIYESHGFIHPIGFSSPAASGPQRVG
ncbi:MAG: CHAP domain-containing protein [Hyphomonadaceae bacterium]|nr:CHAP domain-containing protein [Hyphomonadaceae bacterium]